MSDSTPDLGITLTAEPMVTNRRRRAAIGQGIRLTARVFDRTTGILTAATDTTIIIQPPVTSFGALPAPLRFPISELTPAGTGVWRLDVLADKAGIWPARAECSAPRAAAVEI